MAGTVWLSRVAGPVIHVTVPSATVPASSSIFGPSAAMSTGNGVAPPMLSVPFALSVAPRNAIFPS